MQTNPFPKSEIAHIYKNIGITYARHRDYEPSDNEKMVEAFETFLAHGNPADQDREQIMNVVNHEKQQLRLRSQAMGSAQSRGQEKQAGATQTGRRKRKSKRKKKWV